MEEKRGQRWPRPGGIEGSAVCRVDGPPGRKLWAMDHKEPNPKVDTCGVLYDSIQRLF